MRFEVSGVAPHEAVLWSVNGRALPGRTPEVSWPLAPGRHHLVAAIVDAQGAARARLQARFLVR